MTVRTVLVAVTAVLLLAGAAAAADEPTLDALRAQAQERMSIDRRLMSDQEFREIESLYQQANRDLRAPAAKETLVQLVAKYPKSNRAGCALLYLAQMSAGSERESYLKKAIEKYGESWYGNGVQVGALARAQLAIYYANNGRPDDARKLAQEIGSKFPGAVDHSGARLAAGLRVLHLLE